MANPRISVLYTNDEEETSQQSLYNIITNKKVAYILFLGPLATAIEDTADTGMSLYRGNLYNNMPLFISAINTSFVTSLSLNSQVLWYTLHPDQDQNPPLKTLAPHQKLHLRLLSILPILSATLTKGVKTYFFVTAIPNEYAAMQVMPTLAWKIGSLPLSLAVSLNTLLTTGSETYKTLYRIWVKQPLQFCNKTSKVLSSLLGGSAGIIDSLQFAAGDYIAIKNVFRFQHPAALTATSLFCMQNGISNFCLSGFFAVTSLDRLFKHIYQKQFNKTTASAFVLASILSVYLAYLQQPLTLGFYQDIYKEFSDDITPFANTICQLLSWATFADNLLLGTASLYDPLSCAMQKTLQGAQSSYHKAKSWWERVGESYKNYIYQRTSLILFFQRTENNLTKKPVLENADNVIAIANI